MMPVWPCRVWAKPLPGDKGSRGTGRQPALALGGPCRFLEGIRSGGQESF